MSDIILEFRAAMEADGILCTENIYADGKMHRFTPPGGSQKCCWYKLFNDYPPSGVYGNWTTGFKNKWSVKPGRELTIEEKESFKKRIAADRVRKHREEERLKAKAKKVAGEIWALGKENQASHPYFLAKVIKPHIAKVHNGQVIVPVKNNGELVGFQEISGSGDKKFLHGTPVKGSYCVIGQTAGQNLFFIAEGFATAASIFEATNIPCVVAFNAGNLEPVAKVVREKFPNAKIIIAADDDRWTQGNPGIVAAASAVSAINGELRRPIFKPGYDGKPTDFNDVAKLYGFEELKQQLIHNNSTFEIETIKTVVPRISDSVLNDMLPDQEPGKKPMSSISNLEAVLNRVGATIRYNVIKKTEEWFIPGEETSLDNQKNVIYARIVDLCLRCKMPVAQIKDFLLYLSDKNQFNPVMEWIKAADWDGISRLGDFCATITVKNEATMPAAKYLKNVLITRWLVSAVAAAARPNGIAAQGVLVLQGDQYIGKTRWFKKLVPESLGLISEGKTLKPDDKDSVKQVISYWIVELGELDATFRKSDIAMLKSFLTRDHDIIRLPYAPCESMYARRTVFFGSVNKKEFLADDTGNRRYWTLECDNINHEHEINMQQLWAEIYSLYKDGEQWHLDKDEMALLNQSNQDFEMRDPIEERILSHYAWVESGIIGGEWKSATEIMQDIGSLNPSKGEINRASMIVKKLNGAKTKKVVGRVLLLIPSKRGLFERLSQ